MPPATPVPPISVAFSAYNGERFVEQQLESLARQTVPPAELLVCDDCSSDGTPVILKRFSRPLSRSPLWRGPGRWRLPH